jgi:hypothetical protein
MKTSKNSPYGKVVTLSDQATAECWNFTDRSTHVLPAGTRLLLEHVHESDSTTCMLVDEIGNHPGIMLRLSDGKEQRGYRFILKNAELNRLSDAKLPKKVFDLVGAMMSYEAGEMTKEETISFFKRLKRDGLLSKLQGHYGRTAARLGII